MDDTGLKSVFRAYGLMPVSFLQPQKGYRNTSFPAILENGERINFILYKNEPGIYERIKRIHAVSEFLADRGFPVRRPLYMKIMQMKTDRVTRYGALYSYLSGDTIPWEGYTKNHIKLVGMALGSMHERLQKFGPLDGKVSDEYLRIVYRMHLYFKNDDVIRALDKKLHISLSPRLFSRFEKLLTYCNTLPGQQALHMDFVRGNLLFRPARLQDKLVIENVALSGILDFEKTAFGPPIFDVARTLAFLLVDCKYKRPEKIRKHFLYSGYNKRSNAKSVPLDSELLERLVILFLVYDFYKFLRHNPYEYLLQNEHFIRTRDMLVTLGVIRYTKDR